MNYFIFKNIDTRLMTGLIVTSLPPITKPKLRVERLEIDGRDGSIINELGYESYEKQVEIGLTRNYDLDYIMSWLNGEGEITFSNEPDKYYRVKIINQIDYEKLLRFKKAVVTFETQPFKYSNIEGKKTFEVTGLNEIVVRNIGNYKSKPIITLYGNGIVNVSLNGTQQFVIDLTNDTSITLDSEEQEAYSGNELKNRQMEGQFINLEVNKNIITWNGTLTKIEISRYSRWL